jgi:hypothetical protein
VVIDRFAFDIHFADVAHATDTHDGDAFLDAAINNGTVAVYVTRDLDPRRSTPADLQAVAQTGDLLAGDVPAFQIDLLPD